MVLLAAFFAADELVPYILSEVFDTFIWKKHVLAEIPTYKMTERMFRNQQ